jgi:hypothetical protein
MRDRAADRAQRADEEESPSATAASDRRAEGGKPHAVEKQVRPGAVQEGVG